MAVQTSHGFVTVQPITLGWILAVIVLIVAIILMILSMLDIKLGLMIALLAVARLV